MEFDLNSLLFLVLVPLLLQGIKLLRDKKGKTLGKLALQLGSLALAAAFTFLNKGFSGLAFPALPGADGDVLLFAKDLIAVVGLGWASMSGLYELLFDRLFTRAGYATQDKYAAG